MDENIRKFLSAFYIYRPGKESIFVASKSIYLAIKNETPYFMNQASRMDISQILIMYREGFSYFSQKRD